MPLTERDPNVSGRTSRESHMSASSRRTASKYNPTKTDMLSAAPGVMSMLRTTTEIGDVGSVAFNPGRHPGPYRNPMHRRPGHGPSRPGTASSHHSSYQGSHTSRRVPHHHAWPSASSGPRRSITSSLNVPQLLPDTMSPTLMDLPGSSPLVPHARLSKDGGRSYSMTHPSRPSLALSNHRSLTSLRSHGAGAVSRPRSPYVYPTRLRRPGYRPTSPALSDITGVQRRTSYRLEQPHPRVRVVGPREGHGASYGSPHMQPQSRIPLAVNPQATPPMTEQARSETARNVSTPSLKRLTSSGAAVSPVEEFTPSSKSASPAPPTPVQGVSPKVHIDTAVAHEADGDMGLPGMPGSYEYVEQLEKRSLCDAAEHHVTMGFVQRVQSILDDKAMTGHVENQRSSLDASDAVELPESEAAELPATPVPRRITREMILAAVEPSSDKGGDDTTMTSIALRLETGTVDDTASTLAAPEEPEEKSQHIESDSSTASEVSVDEGTVSFEVGQTNGSPQVSDPSQTVPGAYEPHEPSTEPSEENNHAASGADYDIGITVTAASDSSMVTPSDYARATETVHVKKVPAFTQSRDKLTFRLTAPPVRVSTLSNESDASYRQVSDVAVRFSLPPMNVRSSRVTIHPTVSVATKGAAAEAHDDGGRPTDTEGVAPAAVSSHHSGEQVPAVSSGAARRSLDNETTTDLVLNGRRPFSASINTIEGVRPLKRLSNETTTDLRFSYFRSPAAPLPDLKEESVEEVSLPNLRASGFRFPLTRSTSAAKLPESIRLSRQSRASSFKAASQALADARVIPSLNFSRMDLFSKLNEALETRSTRSTRSLDEVHVNFQEIHSPQPHRPSSSEMLRDRYRSWFLNDLSVENIARDLRASIVPAKRTISPEQFISEVNQLSIPSVNGLTERLSEWLPSMKNYMTEEDVTFEEEHIESALSEIRGLGKSRTSLPAKCPGTAVPNTEDAADGEGDAAGTPTQPAVEGPPMKRLSLLPDQKGEQAESGLAEVKLPTKQGRTTPLAELEASTPPLNSDEPSGALEDKEDRHLAIHVVKKTPGASSTPSSRPWNLDESYPWADTSMTIDITMPGRIRRKQMSCSELSNLHTKGSESTADLNGDNDLHPARKDITSANGPPPSSSANHKRKGSKRSLLESITRKIGLHGPFDNSGYPTGPEILPPGDRAVDPGDRYPTTGLNPPSAFNIDEVRSFFSDNSSQTERGGSFRKRLTGLKSKRPLLHRAHSVDGNLSIGRDNGSVFASGRSGAAGSVHTYDGTGGMSRMEFRARKVVEKLKSLWFKSGELIRTMSGRKKAQPRHDEDDEDWIHSSDLYSGV